MDNESGKNAILIFGKCQSSEIADAVFDVSWLMEFLNPSDQDECEREEEQDS